DGNNNPASGVCNDANESVIVSNASPTLTTAASAGIVLGGGSVHDTATLANGVTPTGTITFRLFGPNDAACSSGPAFTSVVPVAGNTSYASANFTPAASGMYR